MFGFEIGDIVKNTSIPLIATLCCTLTACGEDKEPIEESEPATEPSSEEPEEVEVGDISAILGAWDVTNISQISYGETVDTSYPSEEAQSYEGYGINFNSSLLSSIILEFVESGDVMYTESYTGTKSLEVSGEDAYSISYGGSYAYGSAIGSVRQSDDTYTMELDDDLDCTLTGDDLVCSNSDASFVLEMSRNTEGAQDSFESIETPYPSTPSYTKEDCVDSNITQTGNALEWGGFGSEIDNDVVFECFEEDLEDLVFEFVAPNDGCFAFNTTGTMFEHGLQLMDSCDGEVLKCAPAGPKLEHGLSVGESVLVVIDAAAAEQQVFNLSINEVSFDVTGYDTLEFINDEYSADTTGWMDSVETDCTLIGGAKTYLWTATSTGTATLSTEGSDFDTAIGVQIAECGGVIECNDDESYESEMLTSLLDFDVVQDAQYLISVGGYGEESGNLSMSLTIAE
jgi:hypothetical protein